MARGVTYKEKTEQCHHQTDAITKPLGKQKGRYVHDKLEKKRKIEGWRRHSAKGIMLVSNTLEYLAKLARINTCMLLCVACCRLCSENKCIQTLFFPSPPGLDPATVHPARTEPLYPRIKRHSDCPDRFLSLSENSHLSQMRTLLTLLWQSQSYLQAVTAIIIYP